MGTALLTLRDTTIIAATFDDSPPSTVHAATAPAAVATAFQNACNGLPWSASLAPAGTPFQLQVWAMLATIPAGTTLSYTALAERIATRTSTRAVARAVATNPIAVLVPCHRIIGADGDLRGYRWGLARKRALLLAEGALMI